MTTAWYPATARLECLRIELRRRVGSVEACEDAGDLPPVVRRRPGRSRPFDLVAEDLRFELAQRRPGLEAEPSEERPAGVAVDGQGVGLAPRAVEGPHQELAQPLVERMLGHQRLELAGDLGTRREVGRDPIGGASQAERLEPRHLRLRKRSACHVGQGRAAPKLERRPQRRGSLAGPAVGRLVAAAPRQRLEPVGVHRRRIDRERVAGSRRADGVHADRGPQARGHHLDGVARVDGRRIGPQAVDDLVGRHGLAAVREEQAEQVPCAAARDGRRAAVIEIDLDRTEDAILDAHPARISPG